MEEWREEERRTRSRGRQKEMRKSGGEDRVERGRKVEESMGGKVEGGRVEERRKGREMRKSGREKEEKMRGQGGGGREDDGKN